MTDAITPAAAVPVGGGKIFAEHGVVITQPVAGTFVAFSAICPHRQCVVRAVAAGTINCFCHGSRFRISDGSVVGGPADGPLSPRDIVVIDGMIALSGGSTREDP